MIDDIRNTSHLENTQAVRALFSVYIYDDLRNTCHLENTQALRTLVLSLPSHKKTHQLCLAAAVLIPAQIPPELHLLSAGLPKVVTCLNLPKTI